MCIAHINTSIGRGKLHDQVGDNNYMHALHRLRRVPSSDMHAAPSKKGLQKLDLNGNSSSPVLEFACRRIYNKHTPDVVLFVERFDLPRRVYLGQGDLGGDLQGEEVPLLHLINRMFGPKLWAKVLVALTHSNSIRPDWHG